MADKKISALTPSTTPLTGAEVLPIVQSGSTVKVSVADLTVGRAVAATSITTGLGAVGTPAYTFSGDTNTGIYSPTADTIAFVEGGTEAMRIDSSGNVGIGTSAPASKLAVGGNPPSAGAIAGVGAAGGISLALSDNANNSLYVKHVAGGAATIGTDSGGQLAFATNGFTERMRINSSGDLLVGQTAGGFSNGNSMTLEPSAGYCVFNHLNGTASGTKYHYFAYNGGDIGSITQNGTTGVLFNITSDARLKDNIENADDAASLIDALQVRKFDWKSDGSHQRHGFIAQELIEVAPEAVSQPADPDDMMGVDYSKLVPMLVKEIQSLRARVAQLEGN